MDFRNKKVLVTGGGGFIPSHVVMRLLKEGANVYVVTKYDSIFDNVRLAPFWYKLNIIEADLRNLDSLRLIARAKPHIIYHMAAYNHVGDSFNHVSETLHCNHIATANLLDAYKDFEKFVYISTSEIYGYQKVVPFHEDMTPLPISPYAVGKYSGELYSRMMHHVYGLPIAIARPFNTFGPYQSPRAVIGEMIIKCLRGQEILATKGKQTREFNYVDNIVDGLMAIGKSEASVGEVINISSGHEISIEDLITMIHRLTSSKATLRLGALPYRPTEIWRMYGDNKKAQALLHWQPKISFEAGIEKTIEWYKKYIMVFENSNSPLLSLGEE